ncbi:MAG: oligosaccharide flippase family protein [Actinomycetota bacterium]|nr:oligosaccharide flippase family protein [Actinomycetota bacterium]
MIDSEDRMSREEVRSRAISGVVLLSLRTLGIRIVGLAGNIALARLLVPEDFGAIAIGLSIVGLGSFLADAGIGAALIGRQDPPTRRELSAVAGLQLTTTSLLLLVATAICLPLGHIAQLSAVMLVSVPFMTLRTPAKLILERNLRYGPAVRVEILDVLVYNVWAIGGAAIGAGAWALATGTVVRAIVGSLLMLALVPAGRIRPRWDLHTVRPFLKFGIGVQAGAIQLLVRDYVLNFTILAIAGTTVLGIVALAGRVLQIPMLVFQSLWQVSYPAVSRMLEAGEDPRAVIQKGAAMLTVGSGALLTGLVAASPALIPSVFGSNWSDAADYMPGACLALLVGGPISATVSGYLLARGRALPIVRIQIVGTLTWWAAAFSLVRPIGAAGLGIGWAASSIIETLLLARLARRASGARVFRACGPTMLTATAVGGVSWLIARSLPATVPVGLISGAIATAAFCGVLLVLDRPLVWTVFALLRSLARRQPAVTPVVGS